jgi:hypothetical protein
LHHHLHHRSGIAVDVGIAHERSVDLQDVDRQMLQAGKGGVSGPEVVDRDLEPGVMKELEDIAGVLRADDDTVCRLHRNATLGT